MKCFLVGAAGGLLVLLAAALIYPLYGDYRAAAETSQWLMQLEATKRRIEAKFEADGSLAFVGEGVERPQFDGPSAPSYINVTENGAILLKGGRVGQLVVIMPVVANGELAWTCVGGPTNATLGCRNAP